MTAQTLWERQQTYESLKAIVQRIPRLRESKVLITMRRVDRMLRAINAVDPLEADKTALRCLIGVEGETDAGTAALATCMLLRAAVSKQYASTALLDKLGFWHTWLAPLGRSRDTHQNLILKIYCQNRRIYIVSKH